MINDDNTWLVHSSPPTWHSCLHGESQEDGLPDFFMNYEHYEYLMKHLKHLSAIISENLLYFTVISRLQADHRDTKF